MDRHSLPSIEEFAAFLDGNLSQREMEQILQLAEQDNVLHQLIDASSAIDDTIECYRGADKQLPPEISGSSFEIPPIPSIGLSNVDILTPESIEKTFVAGSANVADDTQELGNEEENNFEYNEDSSGIDNTANQILNNDEGLVNPQESSLLTDNPE